MRAGALHDEHPFNDMRSTVLERRFVFLLAWFTAHVVCFFLDVHTYPCQRSCIYLYALFGVFSVYTRINRVKMENGVVTTACSHVFKLDHSPPYRAYRRFLFYRRSGPPQSLTPLRVALERGFRDHHRNAHIAHIALSYTTSNPHPPFPFPPLPHPTATPLLPPNVEQEADWLGGI